MPLSQPQKHLLIIYVPMTVLVGVLFYVLHYVLSRLGLTLGLITYTLMALAAGLAIYVFYFRHKVKAVKYKGAGVVTVATVYFMVMLTVSWAGIKWAAVSTDTVSEVESIYAIDQASSPYFHIQKFHVRPDHFKDDLTVNEDKDEDGFISYQYRYNALVPLSASAADTVHNTWIEFLDWASVNHGMTEGERRQFEDQLVSKNRDRISSFAFDSIDHFSRADLPPHLHLLQKHNLPPTGLVILHPQQRSPAEVSHDLAKFFTWAYVGLSIFFLGAVALGNYEAIIQD